MPQQNWRTEARQLDSFYHGTLPDRALISFFSRSAKFQFLIELENRNMNMEELFEEAILLN